MELVGVLLAPLAAVVTAAVALTTWSESPGTVTAAVDATQGFCRFLVESILMLLLPLLPTLSAVCRGALTAAYEGARAVGLLRDVDYATFVNLVCYLAPAMMIGAALLPTLLRGSA
jgi:hypothetical protein